MRLEIYTDGACSGNPGKGGYSFILKYPHMVIRYSEGFQFTTNNRMELMAIIRSIKAAKQKGFTSNIKIYSDSSYCINSITQGWIYSWEKNNWKTKQGEEVKNKDLWQELFEILKDKNIHIDFLKVKGHSGNKYNEEADKLAKSAILHLNGNSLPSEEVKYDDVKQNKKY